MKKTKVKEIAIAMVKEVGLINLSRKDLCARAGVADGSFPYIMGCTFSEFIEELQAEGFNSMPGVVSKKRANPGLRKDYILAAAIELAKENTYQSITREMVAVRAGVSGGLISRYFGTVKQLQRDIMRHAIKDSILEIIAQGLAAGDRFALKAPPEVKKEATELLLTR